MGTLTTETVEQEPEVAEVPTDELMEISQWEFIGRPPTRTEVLDLLRSIPDVHGVATVDFAEFVQALPQSKKLSRPQVRDKRVVLVDEWVEVWALYMSVAGRLAMLNLASERNCWRADFRPEPTTPTGIPGMLAFGDRIVYREYLTISERVETKDEACLGSRPGTAWVPAVGGKNAAGSNPYEKVETAARGRALAAWGFGLLPGSGVASIEEMAGIALNRAALEAGVSTGQKATRADMELAVTESVRALAEARAWSAEYVQEKVSEYVQGAFGVTGAVVTPQRVDLSVLSDGQLILMAKSMKDSLEGS